MQVRWARWFGFIGPNGAVSRSTIKLLMRLIFPTAGKRANPCKPISDVEMARAIGYLPEQPYFYDYLTAAELLDYFARFHDLTAADRKERVERMLKKVGLENRAQDAARKYSRGCCSAWWLGAGDPARSESSGFWMSRCRGWTRRQARGARHYSELKRMENGDVSTHILSTRRCWCDRVGVIAAESSAGLARRASRGHEKRREWRLFLSERTSQCAAAFQGDAHGRLLPAASG